MQPVIFIYTRMYQLKIEHTESICLPTTCILTATMDLLGDLNCIISGLRIDQRPKMVARSHRGSAKLVAERTFLVSRNDVTTN